MEQATFLKVIEAAQLAPTGDNCQPWRYVINGRELDIHFVPARAKAFLDVRNVASLISLGALLENIRLMAGKWGFQIKFRLYPDDKDTLKTAVVSFQEAVPVESPLAAVIPERRTNRQPFQRQPVRESVKTALQNLATSRAPLTLVEDRDRLERLAKWAGGFDRFILEHREIHNYLFRWIRWTREESVKTRDGMPIDTLIANPVERIFMRPFASWPLAKIASFFKLNLGSTFRATELYRQCGGMGLLSVKDFQPETIVEAGEVFQRTWLYLTAQGLSLQPMMGLPLLVVRRRLLGEDTLSAAQLELVIKAEKDLVKPLPEFVERHPLVLFRFGYAPPASARTYRLPLDQVLELRP